MNEEKRAYMREYMREYRRGAKAELAALARDFAYIMAVLPQKDATAVYLDIGARAGENLRAGRAPFGLGDLREVVAQGYRTLDLRGLTADIRVRHPTTGAETVLSVPDGLDWTAQATGLGAGDLVRALVGGDRVTAPSGGTTYTARLVPRQTIPR